MGFKLCGIHEIEKYNTVFVKTSDASETVDTPVIRISE